jgi:hypothetical protein
VEANQDNKGKSSAQMLSPSSYRKHGYNRDPPSRTSVLTKAKATDPRPTRTTNAATIAIRTMPTQLDFTSACLLRKTRTTTRLRLPSRTQRRARTLVPTLTKSKGTKCSSCKMNNKAFKGRSHRRKLYCTIPTTIAFWHSKPTLPTVSWARLSNMETFPTRLHHTQLISF